MARKAVRLSDIAEKLGVSTVTVSNALANQRGVSEELREKIKEMASEMGYHAPGTQIMAKTAVNIGVLVQERYLGNGSSFYWRLYQELAIACAAHNCLLAFCVLKPDEEKNTVLPVMVSDHRIDGLIVMGEISRAYLRMLEKEAGMPMIFLDFFAAEFDVDCVISNNFYGMYTATRHLIKKGHKKIAYVGSVKSSNSIADRYFGYLKAMRQYGLEEREEWIVEDRTSGTMEIIEPKLPKDMPTAFVCNCDQTASVLIHELEGNGYRVPEDVSVVGYDNFVFMPVCDVAITTYGVDMPEMAKAASERIISRVKGLDKGPGRLSIISGNLIDGESVRALI